MSSVRMLYTKLGSFDGFVVKELKAGNVYEVSTSSEDSMPAWLAMELVKRGMAEWVER